MNVQNSSNRVRVTLRHLRPQTISGVSSPFVETLIVGGGFSGIMTALELQKNGSKDFLILEQSERVGGTWENNRYPGAECDVPSLSYLPLEKSSTFIPTMRFSNAQEIQRFAESLVDEHQLRSFLRFNASLKACDWDESTHTWNVTYQDLQLCCSKSLRCRYLVLGIGPLSLPHLPDISTPFQGTRIHSANWPKSNVHLLEGKTVAIVGTGASAIQVIPTIASKVKKLYVFQRTPAYVDDKPVEGFVPPPQLFGSQAERVAFIQHKRREFNYWADELYLQLLNRPKLNAYERERWKERMGEKVADAELREKLTPLYPMGCKRLGYVNGYYESLQLPHVELIAEEVKAELPGGLVTSNDREVHDLDVIIYCTGFDAPFVFFEEMVDVRGVNGAMLKPSRTGYKSLYGIHLGNNYPNTFSLCGPQGFIVHVATTSLIDIQADYIAKVITFSKDKDLTRIVPTAEACEEWTQICTELGRKSGWRRCTSWYNRNGEDFVGFAGKLSLYCEYLLKDGFSKLEFSSAKGAPQRFPVSLAQFDMASGRRPPWPVLEALPHEDR